MTTFSLKQLRVTFVLNGPNTFSNGTSTLTLTNLRASATIATAQYPAFPNADVRVWGMLQADMNTLTDVSFHPAGALYNTVIVEANSGTGWTTAFSGQIVAAQPIYANTAEAVLQITARVLYYESLKTTAPTSYTGATDVATIISGLAGRIGATFTNAGVNVKLSNPYFAGTIADQLRAVVQQANIAIYFDYGPLGATGATPPIAITIAPKFLAVDTAAPIVSPGNGLIGYPTIDGFWQKTYAQVLYNPQLKFGGKLTIQDCDVPRANGTWLILQLTHTLESIISDGQWFSDLVLLGEGVAPYPTAP